MISEQSQFSKYQINIPSQRKDTGLASYQNDNWLHIEIHAMDDHVKWLVQEIATIENMIDYCAMVLRISQPPISGKVDIRWWKKPNGCSREPIFVKWVGLNGRYTTKEMKRFDKSNLLSKGAAAILVNETWEVIQEAKEYMKKRSTLIALLGRLKNSLSNSRRFTVYEENPKIKQIHLSVIQNLKAAGYDIHQYYEIENVWGKKNK